MDINFKEIESKWKKYWDENNIYKVENNSDKPKYYILDMFPYPSGAGLHVGHPLGYIASDIFARRKKMCGFNVLHPMGFDAFGLPAEQYAIQSGVHPLDSTTMNIERYKEQLNNIGLNYDWSREIRTCESGYYKWTQWIFTQLYTHAYDFQKNKPIPIDLLVEHFGSQGNQNLNISNTQESSFSNTEWLAFSEKKKDEILMNYRLAYRKVSFVNWCEALGTVLANDEIKDGVSERGGHPVEKKPMMQWVLRITAYAERLLNDLEKLDWTDALKNMQRHWIGKSIGAKIKFRLDQSEESLEIFTTRPDTIFGVSFMGLAPEHPFVKMLLTKDQKPFVDSFLENVKNKSSLERQSEVKEMNGVFSGSYAIHPFTGDKIPIWLSDYVLIEYGNGAIMGVPGHDSRDKLFAIKYNLAILKVVDQSHFPNVGMDEKIGTLQNSSFLDGLEVKDAVVRMVQELKLKNIGEERVQYKMRDANFSRQRYWGEPFPMSYDQDGIAYLNTELPVLLPHLEKIEIGRNGQSPLSNLTSWVNEVPNQFRETDTMPGYAGSSWYFLRFMDPQNENEFASKSALDYWRDVDLYIGGTEHAVGHLMYARFWNKFLFDLGYVPEEEPFKKLVNQGMIQGIVESLYLVKNTRPPLFVDAHEIDSYSLESLSKIPVSIQFVTGYNTNNTHLRKEGIHKFIQWIPEYKDAKFKSAENIYSVSELPDSFILHTVSEVGKMSKRYHNVVNPDEVVAEYGADCFRMYEMFLGPLEQSKPWDTKGITGVSNFLNKFYNLFWNGDGLFDLSSEEPTSDEMKILHNCIKKVSGDIEQLSLNTAVSAFMICVNELRKLNCNKSAILIPLCQLLAPFAPFITEEIWHLANQDSSIHLSSYPSYDEKFLVSNEVCYPISINGKKRHEWTVERDKTKEQLLQDVIELPEIKKWLEGNEIKKIIFIKDRMINLVL